MNLEDITVDGVKQGHIEDIKTNRTLDIFTKAMNNRGKDLKHITMLKYEGITVGYIYYTSNTENSYSSLFGLEVIEKHRGLSLSNALFEAYFKICENQCIKTLRTKKQVKPFTIYLLQKFGYETPNANKRIVEVLPKIDKRLKIRFMNTQQKDRFFNSRLYKSGQYEIVDNTTEEAIGCIMLNRSYTLTDMEKHFQQRQKVQERFKVYLN